MRRIVLAMRLAAYDIKILRGALERVAKSAWLSLQATRNALSWTTERTVKWCREWDALQRAAQIVDRNRLSCEEEE